MLWAVRWILVFVANNIGPDDSMDAGEGLCVKHFQIVGNRGCDHPALWAIQKHTQNIGVMGKEDTVETEAKLIYLQKNKYHGSMNWRCRVALVHREEILRRKWDTDEVIAGELRWERHVSFLDWSQQKSLEVWFSEVFLVSKKRKRSGGSKNLGNFLEYLFWKMHWRNFLKCIFQKNFLELGTSHVLMSVKHFLFSTILIQSDFRTRSVLVSSLIGFERTPKQLYFAVFTLIRCQMYPIREYFVHFEHNGWNSWFTHPLRCSSIRPIPNREQSLVKGKAGSK